MISEGKLIIEPESEIKETAIKIHFSKSVTIKPKQFVVVDSLEFVSLSTEIAGLYDNYTHLARKGVFTHFGSVLADPGYKGKISLEVFNASDHPVTIAKGDRAGHLIVVDIRD